MQPFREQNKRKACLCREFDLPVHRLPVDDDGDHGGGAGADTGDHGNLGDGCGGHNDDGGGDEINASSSDSETEASFRQQGWPHVTRRSANDRNRKRAGRYVCLFCGEEDPVCSQQDRYGERR